MSTRTRSFGHRPRKAPQPAGSLHLIDLENHTSGSRATVDEVAAAVSRYRRAITVTPVDHVVIATGPTLAPVAVFAWPGSRFLLGRGLDGADDALIGWADDRDRIAHRYHDIYIASGDHRFADLAADLTGRGAHTIAVATARSLSARLAQATSDFIILNDTPQAA